MPARTERDPYTPAQIKQLTEDYLLGRQTRRQDIKGSAKRNAAERFVAEVARIRDEPLSRGEDRYTYYELSKDIMVPDEKHPGKKKPLPQRTLRAYLGRHGKEINPESQKDHEYQGYQEGYVPPSPSFRTEDHFGCRYINADGQEVFCERTKDNTYVIRRGDDGAHPGLVEYRCRRHTLAGTNETITA